MRLSGLRKALPALVLLLIVGAASGALGYLTAGDGSSSDEDTAASSAPEGVRGVVQTLVGDSLRLTTDGGPVELQLDRDTRVEVMRPVTLAQVSPGDWLNAGAVQHNQTVFALLNLVFIPEGRVSPPQ
jgi:hypothetical protein